MHVDDNAEIIHAHLGKALVAHNAGIVDKDVDPAPARVGGLDHRRDLRLIGYRGSERHCLSARFDNLRRNALHSIFAQVVDQHLRANTREIESMGAAQASAGAGDNGDAPAKRQHVALACGDRGCHR